MGSFSKLLNRRQRFRDQKKDSSGKHYLFYAILDNLNVQSDYRQDIYLNQTEAFVLTNILMEYSGPASTQKRYIYVDEFQDFSPLELEMIQRLYPSAIVNLFGDISQCISQKGIHEKSQFPAFVSGSNTYVINENYRNARQITNYVNTTFKMNMLAVGLDGIQKNCLKLPEINISDDDRVAVIIPNKIPTIALKGLDNKTNLFSNTKEIVRGKYNVIPVAFTKGLEFEKVIVMRKGMTRNEFYVACTRAICELYIVEDAYAS